MLPVLRRHWRRGSERQLVVVIVGQRQLLVEVVLPLDCVESNRVESVEAIRLTFLVPKLTQDRHRQSAILCAQNRDSVQTV